MQILFNIKTMENLSIILCAAIMLLLIVCQIIFLNIFDKKREALKKEYEKLLNLKDWYERISDEANRSYIVESVERRGHELINQFKVLNTNLVEIQEQHQDLQKQQQKLHNSLVEEQKLMNQYFENYT